MHVAIGMKVRDGAWGGGNLFARALAAHLLAHGARVSFDLSAPDLDIILVTHPDPAAESSAFGADDALRYLQRRAPDAIVVHRINNSSEARADPHGAYNRAMIRASTIADHTVFISRWLRETYAASGFQKTEHSVILNGADPAIFFPRRESPRREDAVKLVTHHWSTNPRKGFGIYARLDRIVGERFHGRRLAFTYVGRLAAGMAFRHARHVGPLSSEGVAEILRDHDIYVTAAQNEGAGMHHIEGAMCGLPVLYPNSGGIPEYCRGYGIAYEPQTFDLKLADLIDQYDHYRARMPSYPHTAHRMCEQYLDLFRRLLDRRQAIVRTRRIPSRL